MPRIRTIKPEFWSSPSMRGADPWARLLYIAMWNWADDTGRGRANPRELAAFAFPDDEDPIAPTVTEVPSLLAEIAGRWDVVFYTVHGRRYYEISTWGRHQRNERRAQSKYPGPDEGEPYNPDTSDQRKQSESSEVTEVPTCDHGSSDATCGNSVPGTGEQGNRGTGEQAPCSPPPGDEHASPPEDDTFNRFWKLYPRKDNKKSARRAWTKAVKHHGFDELINEAQRWSGLWEAAGTEKRFIPHAATWLNGERWSDEPPTERLRAVSGEYRPFRNPADPSAYEGSL